MLRVDAEGETEFGMHAVLEADLAGFCSRDGRKRRDLMETAINAPAQGTQNPQRQQNDN